MSGEYKIVAENKVGKEEHIFEVRMIPESEPEQPQPKKLAFIEPLVDLTVNDGTYTL